MGLAWATEGTHVKKKAEIKRVRGKGRGGGMRRGASTRLASEKTHVEVFHLSLSAPFLPIRSCPAPTSTTPRRLLPPHLDIPHDMLVFSKGKPFSHFLCPWFLQKASQLILSSQYPASCSGQVVVPRSSAKWLSHKPHTQSLTLVHGPDPFRASTHSISALNCASPNSLRPYLEP